MRAEHGVLVFRRTAAPPVSACPVDSMSQWEFVETAYGVIIILGTCASSKKTRVTTPIAHIERSTRMVTTSSGRRYHLVGPAGRTAVSDLLLRAMVDSRGNGVRVVTHELCRLNGIGGDSQ